MRPERKHTRDIPTLLSIPQTLKEKNAAVTSDVIGGLRKLLFPDMFPDQMDAFEAFAKLLDLVVSSCKRFQVINSVAIPTMITSF